MHRVDSRGKKGVFATIGSLSFRNKKLKNAERSWLQHHCTESAAPALRGDIGFCGRFGTHSVLFGPAKNC